MMHRHKNLKLLGICTALLKGQSEIKKQLLRNSPQAMIKIFNSSETNNIL